MKVCAEPGCPALTTESHCSDHELERAPDDRASSAERGYDHRWRRARKLFLSKNPLCEECLAIGRTEAATVVDHIIPHRGSKRLFWDSDNWQSLCTLHHNRKTARGE